jgi:hypothetical protein
MRYHTRFVFTVTLLVLLRGVAIPQSHAASAGRKMGLTLDDIFACTTGPAQELLNRSVDSIRQADHSPVIRLDDPQVTIHWSLSGDRRGTHDLSKDDQHALESLKERGFCRNGGIKLTFDELLPDRYLEMSSGRLVEAPSGSPPPVSDAAGRALTFQL